ncbi:type II toxin-antitoxin system mRNA interferase toxin, RelE/StbE family [Pseudomonas fluorescens]|uniref:type II toxin-antitoxin system RelE/ParE family toxin n=1 Tax=Pseudomonas fluorescens TaxID=294 RepID=UPI00161143D9|nr:type II toxin-antitoxin system mRNA interferase toxin, RelE/StbE family [Pseudomonas fluorescens]MBD8237849.1 type II toxin-antitoxin system mRNA interferase toxin, RelE/StbE family [Pseudomonas fluorescens]MDY0893393.1 type II toxin-antitoxin system mRNA interferase toxin, RelE/StbE family [Pseudomonas fluorescens]
MAIYRFSANNSDWCYVGDPYLTLTFVWEYLTLLKIQDTPQFIADFKAQLAAGEDPAPFIEVIQCLEKQLPLPIQHCDNPLAGTGRWCCRISHDWWMIYKADPVAGTITLEQTGSNQYLFE